MNEQSLFTAALELPAEQRAGFLDTACGSDGALRERVATLLRLHAEAGDFLDQPASDFPRASSLPDQSGTWIGPYQLLELIGEGGMGVVYRAEQREPVQRQVALKIIKPGMDSRQVIARFEAERQALARMDHPHIAKVHDAGTTAPTDGGYASRPYFVMELVQGVPITQYCDEQQLTLVERLKLFIPVCQALQHAHQKGVIHRDIKPTNILMAEYDGQPLAKVIDFGVAKATTDKLTEHTMFTELGQLVGTPEYMSPEQAELGQLDIDTRSDIYSLGVLLYELLTGSTPLDRHTLRTAGFNEMLRIIREEEPPKPSQRLSSSDLRTTVVTNRRVEGIKLARQVRKELDWIVMKCLEKDRSRRYESASGLAADLQRYLNDEPVQACPPSAVYRLQKLVRRNKGAVLAASLVLLVLVVGIIGTTWGLFESRRQARFAQFARQQETRRAEAEAAQRRRAERAEAEARAQQQQAESLATQAKAHEQAAQEKLALSTALTEFLQRDLLGQAGSIAQVNRQFEPDPNLTVRAAVDRAAAAVGDKFHDRPELEASIRVTLGDAFFATGQYDDAISQFQQSAAIRERQLGPNHLDTVHALHLLSRAYRDGGRTDEAITLGEQVRDAYIKLLGPEHRTTQMSLVNLAWAYRKRGRLAEGTSLFERIREVQERTLGPTHLETLWTNMSLAWAFREDGMAKQAVGLLESTRDASIAKLGPDHPDTVTAAFYLAEAYRVARRAPEAIVLFEQARDARVKSLGPEHPDTLWVEHYLGLAYQDAGKTDDAIKLLKKVGECFERKSGRQHLSTLYAWNGLGMVYRLAGKHAEAIELLERVRKDRIEILGPNDPSTLHTLTNLGLSYRATGKSSDAIAAFIQVCDAAEQSYGPNHPRVVSARNDLAQTYLAVRRPKDAIKLFQAVYDTQVQRHGADDPATLKALFNLGVAHRQAGRLSQAITLFQQVYDTQVKVFGPDHGQTISSLENLAAAVSADGKPEQAAVLYQRLFDIHVQRFGPRHASTLKMQHSLGLAYQYAGNNPEAIAVFEQLWEAQRQALPPGDPKISEAESMLGAILTRAGQFDSAEKHLLSSFDEVQRDGKLVASLPKHCERLTDLYEHWGRPDQAEIWARRRIEWLEKQASLDSLVSVGAMTHLGLVLLMQDKSAEAEVILRDCLAVRKEQHPDFWTTFHTCSLLGDALQRQMKYAEAEPLLLAGWEGMQKQQATMPLHVRQLRLGQALQRIVKLYDAWGKPDQAAEWRKKGGS